MKRIKPIRRLVSIHEAGHAVAAVALNVGIERVGIHLDGILMKGACWLATEPEPVGRLDEVHTLIDAAGEVAVELFQRGGSNEIERHLGPSALRRAHDAYANIGLTFSPERDLPKSDGEHLGDAVALLNHRTPEDRKKYFLDLCLKTIDLLQPFWKAVLWVADELYQFGEVSGDRVRAIVAACSKPNGGSMRIAS